MDNRYKIKYKYYPPEKLTGERSKGVLVKYIMDKRNNICYVEEKCYYNSGNGHMSYTKDIKSPFIGVKKKIAWYSLLD